MSSADRDRFDDLPILAELRDGLERRFAGGARRRRWRWARAGLGGAPIALAGMAAIAVAVVALVAVRHGHPAAPGRPPHPGTPYAPSPPFSPGEQKLIDSATRRTDARDPACVVHANRGATVIHGSPGPKLLSLLGVLRRPAPPADRTYETLLHGGFDAGAGVYINYIRRARTEFGKAYYIVPEARTTPFSAVPERCYAEMRTALRRVLRRQPAAEQRRIVAAQAQQLAVQRQESAGRAGLCFALVTVKRVRPPRGVDMGCSPGVPPLPVGMDGWIGEDHRDGGTLLAGIVPDGVATVTIHYTASGGDPARTLTSTVVNNVAAFEVPPHTFHQGLPARYEFRAGNGSIVRQANRGP